MKPALAVLLALAQLCGQSGPPAALARLRPGDRIGVLTRDGKHIRGTFEQATAASLTIARKQRTEQWSLAEVESVRRIEETSRARSAMWSALVGFGLVFPTGAANAGYLTDRNNPPFTTRVGMGAGLGMYGAGIGAAIGVLAGGSKDVLVYRAPQRKARP